MFNNSYSSMRTGRDYELTKHLETNRRLGTLNLENVIQEMVSKEAPIENGMHSKFVKDGNK